MLPRELLRVSSGGREVAPVFLAEHDYPWLRVLLDEYRRFSGRPRRDLEERMREPLPVAAPVTRVAQARHVLDRFCRSSVDAPVAPRRIRAALFAEAARSPDRGAAVAAAAEALRIAPDAVTRYLFADLGPERILRAPPPELSADLLALHVNLALVQGLLARATVAELRIRGNARDVVRLARLKGLLCTVRGDPDAERFVLELSGPLSLFRRTLVYGRALASLVPRLAWCDSWELRADCMLAEDRTRRIVVRHGAPIFPGGEPPRFDSRLEARFVRDFTRAAPDWDVVREPRPVPAGNALLFPDFEIVHRRQRDRHWLVEIVGFWTRDYLDRKLAHLRAAADARWIVCVDADRGCGPEDLPERAHVVPFRRRIDPAAILAILESD